jgi:hypothetical protein
MKKLKWSGTTLMAAAITLGLAGVAQAATIDYGTDTFDPGDVYFSFLGGECEQTEDGGDNVSGKFLFFGCKSLSYTHSLANYNYDPATDSLTSATLTLSLYDDNHPNLDYYVGEKFDLTFGNFQNGVWITNGSTEGSPFTFTPPTFLDRS